MSCGHLLTGSFLEHREFTCLELPFHWNPELVGSFGGGRRGRRLTCSIVTLFSTNTTKIGLELNADLDGETPATTLYTHCCDFLYSAASYKLQDRPQAFK